jgi:hypothetical protein
MARQKRVRVENIDDILEPNEVRALLSTLCIKMGFCLPPPEIETIVELPPRNVEEFARAVFVAEGLGWAKSDPLFKKVKEIVGQAFVEHNLRV